VTTAASSNLRFERTNPVKEEQEYIDSITEDVRWLGANWEDRLFFGSDYFGQMYEWAIQLNQGRQGLRLRPERRPGGVMRGSLTAPGKESPYRNRSAEETWICSSG